MSTATPVMTDPGQVTRRPQRRFKTAAVVVMTALIIANTVRVYIKGPTPPGRQPRGFDGRASVALMEGMTGQEVKATMGTPARAVHGTDGAPVKWYYSLRHDPVELGFSNGRLTSLHDPLMFPKTPLNGRHPFYVRQEEKRLREETARGIKRKG